MGDVTGTIGGNNCALYCQSVLGFWRSSDQGVTWSNLKALSSIYDTRFFQFENVCYVAGQHDIITTGIPAQVWRFVEPVELIIPQSSSINCASAQVIALNYNADCFEGELISATIEQTSDKFKLGELELPAKVSGEFGIPVTYSGSGIAESAVLKLRFRAGAYTFDTTVTLNGLNSASSQLTLDIDASNTQPSSNEQITVEVHPDRPVGGNALNEMTFNVEYRDDLFALRSATSPVGAQIGSAQRIGEKMVIPVTLTGTNLALDPAQPLVVLDLETRLTDSMRSTFDVTDLKLNGGDIDYANCMLAATSSNASVDVAVNCGEPLLQRVLRGQRALEITSISPNPADDRLRIEWSSKLTGSANVTVFSSNGAVHWRGTAAGDALTLDSSSWASGVYTVRVEISGESAEGSVVKQ